MIIDIFNNISIFVIILFLSGALFILLDILFKLKNLLGISGFSLILLSILFTKSTGEAIFLLITAVIIFMIRYAVILVQQKSETEHI
jgi:membrane-bound ClpP family serine protease